MKIGVRLKSDTYSILKSGTKSQIKQGLEICSLKDRGASEIQGFWLVKSLICWRIEPVLSKHGSNQPIVFLLVRHFVFQYSKASRYMASSWTDLAGALFELGSKTFELNEFMFWKPWAARVFDHLAFTLGTIHILRNHIFRIFGPPSPPYVIMFLALKIIKNWHFLTPPPYKWLRNIWMVPY